MYMLQYEICVYIYVNIYIIYICKYHIEVPASQGPSPFQLSLRDALLILGVGSVRVLRF